MILDKGYVQVYTGDGKGKTTASLGVTLRMLCAGGSVFFGQFMKGQDSSEHKAMDKFDKLEMRRFGDIEFLRGEPTEKDINNAKAGFEVMKEALLSGKYDLVVFDEINTSIFFGLLDQKDLFELLDKKPEKTEVILTGRKASDEIIDYADLVTEMKEIKHYFNTQGVNARLGIED